jgi:predicted membrane-bound spermidine synthase
VSGNRTVAVAFGVCSAVSVTAQFSLARITLTTLSGNEFGAGLFLGFWLLFGGAGCVLLPAINRAPRRPAAAFSLLLLLLGILLPASCFAIVLARRLLFGLALSLPLASTLGLAALAAFPVSLAVGALFSAAVQAAPDGQRAAPVLYLADATGSFAGGLLASFILAPLLPTIAIALLAAAIVLLTGAVVALRLRAGLVRAGACAAVGIAAAAIVAMPASRNAAVDALARARFPSGEVVASVDSRYQSFTAVRQRESLSFYQDGVLTFFSQAGEREEEMAHLALLSLPMPSSVLVVGNGWPFLTREILKHPIASLEVIVEDEVVHRTGMGILPAELTSFQSDPRLRIYYGDPRQILRDDTRKYRAVFLDGGAPETLLSVRPYTREFLQWLAGLLEEDGIVVLAAPSVESRLSPALLSLNASFVATLLAVFPAVVVIPGDYAGNVIIAGRGIGPSGFEPKRLADVLESRGIAARWIDRHSLTTILDPGRMAAIKAQLGSAAGALNTLENPALLLSSLEYREEMSGGRLALTFLRGFRLWHAAAGILALALALVIAGWLLRRDTMMPGCAAAAGFSGMVAELSLLGAFQLVSGSLYAGMAWLVGLFMAGMAGGSAAAPALVRRVEKMKADRMLAAALLFGLIAAGAVATLSPLLMGSPRGILLPFLSAAMALSGFSSGACMALLLGRRQASRAAPVAVYAADLLGGAVGGACAGVLLLPVIGSSRSLWFAAMGYGSALLILAGSRLMPHVPQRQPFSERSGSGS